MIIDDIEYNVIKNKAVSNGTLYDEIGASPLLEKNGLYFHLLSDNKLSLCAVDQKLENSEIIILPQGCTTIESYAFDNVSESIKYVIGKNVTRLMDMAFYKCKRLKSVELGKLSIIEQCAFFRCTALEYLPDLSYVSTLGRCAFWGCKLKGYINRNGEKVDGCIFIPKNITDLMEETFKNSKVTNVIFEDSGSYQLYRTFEGCKKLTYCNLFDKEANLPNTTLRVGESSFSKTAINNITLKEWMVFSESNQFSHSTVTTVEVHSPIVPEDCFTFCLSLKKVTCGDECEKIMAEAFSYCPNLTELDLNKVKSINRNGFSSSGVTSVKTNARIGANAFFGCFSLKSIDIGGKINKGSFGKCFDIENVSVKDVSQIGKNSLPVHILKYIPDLEADKIFFSADYFLNQDYGLIHEDVVEYLKGIFTKYEGGYYAGTKDNPYHTLVFYDGDDGKLISQNDYKEIIVHPDCDTITRFAFNNRFLAPEIAKTPPYFALRVNQRYNLLESNTCDLLSSVKCLIIDNQVDAKYFNTYVYGIDVNTIKYENIKDIVNPFTSNVAAHGIIILPEEIESLTQDYPLYRQEYSVILPKKIANFTENKITSFMDKPVLIHLFVREGTDANVLPEIKQMFPTDTRFDIHFQNKDLEKNKR